MPITLKQLIYSKCVDEKITQELLHICDSSTWLEDLIDLIIELHSGFNEDVEEEILKLKDMVHDLQCQCDREAVEINENDNLKNTIEDLEDVLKKYKNNLVVGGIICPTK